MDSRFFSRSPYDSNLTRFVSNDRHIDMTNGSLLFAKCWKHANAVDDLIRSYEHFIDEGINEVLASYPIIFNRTDEDGNIVPSKRFIVSLDTVTKPTMTRFNEGSNETVTEFVTPEYAHLRNLTLMTSLTAKVTEERYNEDADSEEDAWVEVSSEYMPFGKIPTMVRSKYCNTGGLSNRELYEIGECPTWPGGYFVAKGNMCTISMKQKLRDNKFHIYFDTKTKEMVGDIICRIPTGTTRLSITRSDDGITKIWSNFIKYSVSGNPEYINIFYLLAILHKYSYNITDFSNLNYADIIDDILRFVDPSVRNTAKISLEETKAFMGAAGNNYETLVSELLTLCNMSSNHTEMDLFNTIRQSLFPQFNAIVDNGMMTSSEEDQSKYFQLCYYIAKYTEFKQGKRTADDRNSISNCMFETPGIALRTLFHDIYKSNITELYDSIVNRIPDMSNIRQFINKVDSSITKQTESSIRSNTWGAKGEAKSQNMVEPLRLDTVLLLFSEITKINIPSSRQGRQTEVRENHQSQCGYIDFVNSPESDSCGLTSRKAVTCQFSLNRDDDDILDIVWEFAIPLYEDEFPEDYDTYVFVNGKLLGLVNGEEMSQLLIMARRNNEIAFDTMICYDRTRNELYIHTDGGRPVRPLLIVNPDTGNLVINEKNLWDKSFKVLLREHAVEYIDAAEQEYAIIATSPNQLVIDKYRNNPIKYTHSELDPNAVLGVSAACIPLSNHNMSTKNCYAANMLHQGIGTPGVNYYNRFDTKAMILDAPTRPIMEPQMSRLLGLSQLPFGRGVIVAYMAYNGYNQEDAIIVNRGSLERGVFNYGVYYKYDFEETFRPNNVQVRVHPMTQEEIDSNQSYRGLGPDGIIKVGSRVRAGDVLVRAKRISSQMTDAVQSDDVDLRVSYGQYGTIRRVEISEEAGRKTIKIRFEDNRNILNSIDFIGDKLSSRAATKGVIGITIDEKDIPYTTSGLRPDVIINPLGVPTRAPVNKLIEILTSKGHVMKGERIDGTSFKNPQSLIDKSRGYLREFGLDDLGEEMMIDPRTGREMSPAYIGPCHYMLLTHYAVDKIQGQGQIGRKIIATNQPRKGRKNEGGIRFGEGERDALVAYSNSTLVHDTMCKSSDEYTCVMCVDCGKESALQPLPDQNPSCVNCKGENLRAPTLSGAYKYFTYMTTGLNINVTHDIE